jgi:hypothetical protein
MTPLGRKIAEVAKQWAEARDDPERQREEQRLAREVDSLIKQYQERYEGKCRPTQEILEMTQKDAHGFHTDEKPVQSPADNYPMLCQWIQEQRAIVAQKLAMPAELFQPEPCPIVAENQETG